VPKKNQKNKKLTLSLSSNFFLKPKLQNSHGQATLVSDNSYAGCIIEKKKKNMNLSLGSKLSQKNLSFKTTTVELLSALRIAW
jgi:hypothetical protein